MRVSIFVDYTHLISHKAERVLTIEDGSAGEHLPDELNLYLGSRPAETAVVADRLIEKLQHIRAVALRKAALEDGTITVPGPVLAAAARGPVDAEGRPDYDPAAGDHFAGMPDSVERHVGYGPDKP